MRGTDSWRAGSQPRGFGRSPRRASRGSYSVVFRPENASVASKNNTKTTTAAHKRKREAPPLPGGADPTRTRLDFDERDGERRVTPDGGGDAQNPHMALVELLWGGAPGA